MQFKDYYSIIGLGPSASLADIKKAYRELAMIYHPDKNQGDLYALARFNEIKEAYDVLTDPRRKQAYLQQRWKNNAAGIKGGSEINTPVRLLKAVLDLDRHFSKVDVHRLDRMGMYGYVERLLSSENIAMLKMFGETAINDTIIQKILPVAQVLHEVESRRIYERLRLIAASDAVSKELMQAVKKDRRRRSGEKYAVLVMAVITVLICLLIFVLS